MKTIPVVVGFNTDKQIGYLTIDETKLPAGPNYVFALGYKINTVDYDAKNDKFRVLECELIQVSLQTDSQYLEYLNSESYNDQNI